MTLSLSSQVMKAEKFFSNSQGCYRNLRTGVVIQHPMAIFSKFSENVSNEILFTRKTFGVPKNNDFQRYMTYIPGGGGGGLPPGKIGLISYLPIVFHLQKCSHKMKNIDVYVYILSEFFRNWQIDFILLPMSNVPQCNFWAIYYSIQFQKILKKLITSWAWLYSPKKLPMPTSLDVTEAYPPIFKINDF